MNLVEPKSYQDWFTFWFFCNKKY